MTNYARPGSREPIIVDSAGVAQALVAGVGFTLVAGTYYLTLGSSDAPMAAQASLVAAHFKWNAAFAAVITAEASNFPAKINNEHGSAHNDVTEFSATVGDWVQYNPTTAYVPVIGSGNSATNLTVTAGGTAAGAAFFDIGNTGARRVRFKIVVGTGGVLRVAVNGKLGG